MQVELRKIPDNLILFWHDKASIPLTIAQAVKKTIEINVGSNVIYADDIYMYEFIQATYDKETLMLYKSIKIPASRSDVARLMLLYEYGGVYVDAAMEALRPVESIIDSDSELILVRRDDFPQYADCPGDAHIINGILGAIAKCEFIKDAIHLVLDNLRSRRYDRIWYATGAHSLNILREKCECTYQVTTLNFSKLARDFFVYRRAPGVSNEWVQKQRNGIFTDLDEA